MDTQPEAAVANDANAPVDPTKVFEDLARETFNIKDDEEQPPEEGEQAEPESAEGAEDDPTVEEEADDLPPIDAPVSWDAEAKELFKNLPREAQEIVAKRESEREKFVQSKSQEATRAKQDAVSQATAELARIEQSYAQHFQTLAEQIAPKQPDPAMLQYDPQGFYAQRAQYEAAVAQQQTLQQSAAQYAQQAQARAMQIAQAEQAENHRVIVENFPEYADPSTGPELQRKLTAVAKRLGYPDELIGQARAQDIIAMRNVAELADKADKYDALMKDKMAKVRQAKGLPKVAKPGAAQGPDELRARNAQSALETALNSRDRNESGAAFYEYLQKTGQV